MTHDPASDPPWFARLLRPELSQIRAYVPAAHDEDVLRLDANESPYDLDPDARAAVMNALAATAFQRYPDARATRLRELIAAENGVHPEQVIPGCGSDEPIGWVTAALSAPPPGRAVATVMFPDPSFVMYRQNALLHGMRPVPVALDAAWDLDLDGFLDAIAREQPSVIFLPSPNNPTGNTFSPDRLAEIIRHAPRSLVVLDEAYAPFSGVRYRALREAHPNVAVLQTLSKIGMAAARVGWIILPRPLAIEVDKVRAPYNLSSLAQTVGVAALTTLAPRLAAHARTLVESRERLTRDLSALPGVRVNPSAANFVWVELPADAGRVYDALRVRGVLVRSFHAAGGRLTRCIRVTVGTPAECQRVTTELAAALRALAP